MWPNLCFPPMEGILCSLHGNDILLVQGNLFGGMTERGGLVAETLVLTHSFECIHLPLAQ